MMRGKGVALACICMLSAASSADAEPIPASAGIQVENDLFGSGLDRHYTNGMQVFGVIGSEYVPEPLIDAMHTLPGIDPGDEPAFVLAVGQHMYTPADITAPVPDPSDRPYAGWTYVSLGAAVADADGHRVHDVALDIGIVGPAAAAGETQRRWHALIDTTAPMGWGHQLKNEPGVVLTYQTRTRLDLPYRPFGLAVDVMPGYGGALGNVFTHANVGTSVRIGQNLGLTYGAPLIRPSLPSAGLIRRSGEFGWNVFAGIEGRAVARNIFLDGNSWKSGPSVERRPLVLDAQFGAEMVWDNWRLSFTQILRTREFDGQREPSRFGSLSLSVMF